MSLGPTDPLVSLKCSFLFLLVVLGCIQPHPKKSEGSIPTFAVNNYPIIDPFPCAHFQIPCAFIFNLSFAVGP